MFENMLVLGSAKGWDVGSFLTNSSSTLQTWFNAALIIIGLVAIFWAAWQITSGLMSHGKKQTNWAISIILLIVGGMLTASGGGFTFMKTIAGGGKKTIEDLGGGTITTLFDFGTMFLPFL